jgi:hypothetical protein
MMQQGRVTFLLLQFVGTWNNFLLPFIMLSDQNRYPLALGIYTFMSQGAGDSALYPLVIGVQGLGPAAHRRPTAVLARRPARWQSRG